MAVADTQIHDMEEAPNAPDASILIEMRGVHKAFGRNEVLRGVSFSVEEGKTAVVMGGSGSGKSVLIKHLVQLLHPDRGEVWVMGRRVDLLKGDALDELRLSIGYLFQGGALFDSMTVFQNIDFILDRHTTLNRQERQARIEETLEWVDLADKRESAPSELSGGQKKRIGLARAIILEPRLLLYDEPTTGLDPVSVRSVSRLISRLKDERNITSVAITHDLLCAEIVADRVHFLSDGVIAEEGSLAELARSDHPALSNFFGR